MLPIVLSISLLKYILRGVNIANLLCFTICFICIFAFYFMDNSWLNPGVFFNVGWGTAVFLSSFGFYDLIIPSQVVYLYVLLSIICFNFAYWMGHVISNKKNGNEKDYVTRLNTTIIIILQICLIFMMTPYAIRLYNLHLGTQLGELRNMMYSLEDNMILSGNRDFFVWYTIISSAVVSFIITTVYMIYTRQSTRVIIFLTLIQVGIFSWVSAGRIMVLRLGLFLVIGYFLFNKSAAIMISRKNKFYIVIAMGVISYVFVLFTQLRGSGESLLFWIVLYIAGPLPFMNTTLSYIAWTEQSFMYGGVFWGGLLYYPIYFSNKYFATSFVSATEKLSFLNIPVNISNGSNIITYNSLGSAVLNFYFDAGIVGIIFGFLLFGFISFYFHNKFLRKKSLINTGIMFLTMFSAVYTIWRWEPMNIWVWGAAFFLVVINRLAKSKIQKEKDI